MALRSSSAQLHWEKVKEFFAITLPVQIGDHFIANYAHERCGTDPSKKTLARAPDLDPLAPLGSGAPGNECN